MRGYCPKCKEYRSDNGGDAWTIVWSDDLPLCQRCKSVVDVWPNSNRGNSSESRESKKNKRGSSRIARLFGEFFSLTRNVGHFREYNLSLVERVL